MRLLVFLLVFFAVLYIPPIISSTLIDENQEKAKLKANPIVVEKLLQKLEKYSNKISEAKEKMVRKEDLFQGEKVK